MMNAIKTLLITLPLLVLPGTALANGSHQSGVYEGRVNHVTPGAILRIAYKGGQIHVKARNLPNDDLAAEDLRGRQVRVLDAIWREGYLEGRLELADSARP